MGGGGLTIFINHLIFFLRVKPQSCFLGYSCLTWVIYFTMVFRKALHVNSYYCFPTGFTPSILPPFSPLISILSLLSITWQCYLLTDFFKFPHISNVFWSERNKYLCLSIYWLSYTISIFHLQVGNSRIRLIGSIAVVPFTLPSRS